MAKNETRKLKPSVLTKDLTDFAALKQITGYAPANAAYQITAIDADKTAMEAAADAMAQAEAALKTKRDEYVAATWKFHNSVDGGRTSVESQFGKDSNEVQAVGRKKTSEYKTRAPKSKGGGGGGVHN